MPHPLPQVLVRIFEDPYDVILAGFGPGARQEDGRLGGLKKKCPHTELTESAEETGLC
jgi:hypothetical protein